MDAKTLKKNCALSGVNSVSDWNGDVEEIPEITLDNAAVARLLKHNKCLRDCLASVEHIKTCISCKRFDEGREAWAELEEDEQTALYIAPSKGGIFTTEERKIIHNGFKETTNAN